MKLEWHQEERFYASAEGHFLKIQPMVQGAGYSATMSHLDEEGNMAIDLIGHGIPYDTVEQAKTGAQKFLEDHLATPPQEREARLEKLLKEDTYAPAPAMDTRPQN